MADEEVNVRLTAEVSELIDGLKRGQQATNDSLESMQKSMEGVGETFEDLQSTFRKGLEITGIALAIEAFEKLKEAVDEIALSAVHLEHTAQMIGVTTSEMQGLNAAAEEAGVGTEAMDRGLMLLSMRMQAARDGSAAMQEKLDKVGITIANLEDPSFTAASAAYALAASHATMAEKMDIVGRRGVSLIAALAELTGGQEAAIEKARELGALNQDQIATLAEYHRRVADVTMQWQNFKDRIAAEFAPAIGTLLEQLTKLAGVTTATGEVTDEFKEHAATVVREILNWAEAIKELWLDTKEMFDHMVAGARNVADVLNAVAHAHLGAAKDIWNAGTAELLKIETDHDAAILEARKELADALLEVDKALLTPEVVVTGKRIQDQNEVKTKGAAPKFDESAEYGLLMRMSAEGQKLNATLEKELDHVKVKIDERETSGQIKLVLKDFADMQRGIEQLLAPIGAAFDQSILGMIKGTESLRQAMLKIGQSILSEFITLTTRMVEKWAVSELMKTSLTQSHSVLRSLLEKLGLVQTEVDTTAASTTTIATRKSEALQTIPGEAAVAAGGAAAAMASIPYVGPALAAAAWAETFALVMSGMGAVAAAGGFDIPSGVNPLVQAHQREMILPASIADPLRGMLAGGGGGRGTSITMPRPKQVGNQYLFNKAEFTAAMQQLHREFRLR